MDTNQKAEIDVCTEGNEDNKGVIEEILYLCFLRLLLLILSE
jgi:hypothetical protein